MICQSLFLFHAGDLIFTYGLCVLREQLFVLLQGVFNQNLLIILIYKSMLCICSRYAICYAKSNKGAFFEKTICVEMRLFTSSNFNFVVFTFFGS